MLEKLVDKTGEEVPLKVCFLSKAESAEHLKNLRNWMESDEVINKQACIEQVQREI